MEDFVERCTGCRVNDDTAGLCASRDSWLPLAGCPRLFEFLTTLTFGTLCLEGNVARKRHKISRQWLFHMTYRYLQSYINYAAGDLFPLRDSFNSKK